MELSVVATLYRSAPDLAEFHRRMRAAAERVTEDFEIVYVNDGSPDDSLGIARSIFECDPRVRIIDLSRNFGHHKAVMTGLDFARGERVFLIDSDLEEPPEVLSEFVDTLRERGVDVVYGVQAMRKGRWFERITGGLFYKVFNLFSRQQIPENLTMVRLMTRRYVRALVRHREHEFIIAGLWTLTGFEQVGIPIEKISKGRTTYSLTKKLTALVDAITSFSNLPLVLVFYLGAIISLLSGGAAVWMVIKRLFFSVMLAGWPSLIVSIWLLGGLTISSIGLIGMYLSKIFTEVKQRPYTIVREIYEHPAGSDSDGLGERAGNGAEVLLGETPRARPDAGGRGLELD